MTPEQEDALVECAYAQAYKEDPSASIDTLVRLAIRAAVAAERERCAKVAENAGMEMEAEGYKFSEDSQVRDRVWARSRQSHSIAAAIRRGDTLSRHQPCAFKSAS